MLDQTPRYIPKAEYTRLYESGLTIEEIATELSRTVATVRIALHRAGVFDADERRRQEIHEAMVARAQHLRDEEGMPMVWIAEDLGVSEHWVRKHTTGNPEAVREWKQTWSAIMRHPEMMKIHQEIAPRTRTA